MIKVFRDRAVPLLFAVGLWMLGNAWLAGNDSVAIIPPANAQENQQGQECTDDPVPIRQIWNHCILGPDRYTCSGYCSGASITTRSCKPTQAWYGQFTCTNGSGYGFRQDYAGGCLVDPGAGCECGQGQPVGPSYTVLGFGCTGSTPM